MLAPSAPHRPSPLPAALLAAELGPVVMADDPCEAALSAEDPTGPRKYYRARYYDPMIGRFLSEDPIGLAGGVNFYSYVLNNPVRYIDPTGLDAQTSQPFFIFSPFSVTTTSNRGGMYASERLAEDLHEAVHRTQIGRFDHYSRTACSMEREAFEVEARVLNELIGAIERGERSAEGDDELARLLDMRSTAQGNATQQGAERYVQQNGQPDPMAYRFFNWLRNLF